MITFLRKVRQKLLSDGKFSKYLLYAVGEIVLVVIGILIALQISDWNEGRKNRNFEKEILAQIQANLEKDKITLQQIAKNFNRAVASSEKLLSGNWDQEQTDSLRFWLGNVVQFDRFQPLTNAYEVAKSKGLELISNKDLRFHLGTYYDDQAKHVMKSIGDLETTFSSDWNPVMLEHAIDFRYKQYVVVEDFEIFLNDGKARRILIMNRDNYGSGLKRIQGVIITIEDIEQLINAELQNHEK